jgi:hypothetical protein
MLSLGSTEIRTCGSFIRPVTKPGTLKTVLHSGHKVLATHTEEAGGITRLIDRRRQQEFAPIQDGFKRISDG